MRKEELSYIITAKDKASKVFDKLSRSSERAESGFKSMLPSTNQLGVAFLGIGVGAGAMGLKMIQSASKVETLMTSFEVMTGSLETATSLMKDLDTFANTTPFENMDVRSSAKTLMAFGIEAKNVQGELKSIGDVASGAGVPLNELASIYGKTMAKGKAQAEELNQMVERGIPILEVLGDKYNATGGEIFEMASKGEITGDVIQEAFQKMTGEGGKFENMMEKQSQTIEGKWSTAMGSIGLTTQKLGEMLLPAIAPALDAIILLIQSFNTVLDSGVIQDTITSIIASFQNMAVGIQSAISTVTGFLTDHQDAIKIIAGILTLILLPAIIQLGTQAVITGTQLMVGMIANIISMGIQASLTAVTGMAGLIASVVSFIFEGWAMVAVMIKKIATLLILKASMLAQTAIYIAQNATMVILTASTWLFNTALAVLTSPITLVILAIVALIAIGVLLYKNWEKIKEVGSVVVSKIQQMWEQLKNDLGRIGNEIFTKLTDPFKRAWESIKNTADKIRGAISSAFDMDKRNSPSINDRLGMLKTGVQDTLNSVVVPQYSHDIARALEPSQSQTNNNNVTFNNNISNGLDLAMVDQQLAISLNQRGMI